MGCDWESIIKAGICGVCSLILVPLGVILVIPGIVFISMDTDSGLGIGFLIAASLFLIPGFWMCYYTWKKISNDPTTTSQPGVVIQTPALQPLMTNQAPNQVPSSGVTYPQGQAPG